MFERRVTDDPPSITKGVRNKDTVDFQEKHCDAIVSKEEKDKEEEDKESKTPKERTDDRISGRRRNTTGKGSNKKTGNDSENEREGIARNDNAQTVIPRLNLKGIKSEERQPQNKQEEPIQELRKNKKRRRKHRKQKKRPPAMDH